jgi:hypothetical protein
VNERLVVWVTADPSLVAVASAGVHPLRQVPSIPFALEQEGGIV